MERIPCDPSPDCKYYPNCFEDVHHIYSRVGADTQTKRKFRQLDENKRRNCRAFHEADEAAHGWPPFPEHEVMINAIRSAKK